MAINYILYEPEDPSEFGDAALHPSAPTLLRSLGPFFPWVQPAEPACSSFELPCPFWYRSCIKTLWVGQFGRQVHVILVGSSATNHYTFVHFLLLHSLQSTL